MIEKTSQVSSVTIARKPSRRRRLSAALLLALLAGTFISTSTPKTATAAPIPGNLYRVEYATSPGRWYNGGVYNNYNAAMHGALRYKLRGYAVRVVEDPGGHYRHLPPYTVGNHG